MSAGEFAAFNAGLRTIEHAGMMKGRLYTSKTDVEKAEKEIKNNLSTVKEASVEFNRALGRHKSENTWFSVSDICKVIDGKNDGPMSRFIGNTLKNAHEEVRISRQVVRSGHQKVLATLPEAIRNKLDKPVEIPGVARRLSGQQKLLVVALSGSKENVRMLQNDYGFSLDEIKAIQNSLTKEESNAVKQLWDVNNRLFIMANHNEKSQTGVGMNPGARMMVPLPGGKVEGGNIHWARGKSEKPLPLTFESLNDQTNEVIHHMAYQPIMRDAMKLLKPGGEAAKSIIKSVGPEGYDLLYKTFLLESHPGFQKQSGADSRKSQISEKSSEKPSGTTTGYPINNLGPFKTSNKFSDKLIGQELSRYLAPLNNLAQNKALKAVNQWIEDFNERDKGLRVEGNLMGIEFWGEMYDKKSGWFGSSNWGMNFTPSLFGGNFEAWVEKGEKDENQSDNASKSMNLLSLLPKSMQFIKRYGVFAPGSSDTRWTLDIGFGRSLIPFGGSIDIESGSIIMGKALQRATVDYISPTMEKATVDYIGPAGEGVANTISKAVIGCFRAIGLNVSGYDYLFKE